MHQLHKYNYKMLNVIQQILNNILKKWSWFKKKEKKNNEFG